MKYTIILVPAQSQNVVLGPWRKSTSYRCFKLSAEERYLFFILKCQLYTFQAMIRLFRAHNCVGTLTQQAVTAGETNLQRIFIINSHDPCVCTGTESPAGVCGSRAIGGNDSKFSKYKLD